MEIVYNDKTLEEYMSLAVDLSSKHPVLIDKYILGKEVEVDGICDGNDVLIPGIMEHVERAGVHSGDSIAVYPPRTLSEPIKAVIADYTARLAKALQVVGLFNIQFVLDADNKVYVIEVNPRASRTVPVLSKITGIPMVNIATRLIMGQKLRELGYQPGLAPEPPFTAVKAPVFSFSKLTTVDTFLGPEMKSTGEVMGVDPDPLTALYKALAASGMKLPKGGTVLLSVADRDKAECVQIAQKLSALGFRLMASEGTHAALAEQNIQSQCIPDEDLLETLTQDKATLVINTPTRGRIPSRQGFQLRRTAIEYNIPCITSLDTVNVLLEVMEHIEGRRHCEIYALDEYSGSTAEG